MLGLKTNILTVYNNITSITNIKAGELIYSYDVTNRLPVLTVVTHIDEVKQAQVTYKICFDSGLEVMCDEMQGFFGFRMSPFTASQLQPGMAVRAFSMGFHPRDGHFRVYGYSKGKVKHQYRARMIWEYFNGKVPEGSVIHHINLDKKDDRLENFMLLDNALHSSLHAPKGIKFGRNHKIDQIITSIGDEYIPFVDLQTENGLCIIADEKAVAGDYSGVVCAS
jgi:hypothetical protein